MRGGRTAQNVVVVLDALSKDAGIHVKRRHAEVLIHYPDVLERWIQYHPPLHRLLGATRMLTGGV